MLSQRSQDALAFHGPILAQLPGNWVDRGDPKMPLAQQQASGYCSNALRKKLAAFALLAVAVRDL